MKSESWRQARFYLDWLRVVLEEDCYRDTGQQQFAKHKRKANEMAEFLWQSVRASFPARPGPTSAGNGVTYLGDARVPAAVEHVLNKGPKCSFQPRSTRPELLSHVHRLGQRVQEQDQQRAIGDGIDCLMRTVPLVLDLPGVGANLQDHIFPGGLNFLLDKPVSVLQSRTFTVRELIQYMSTRSVHHQLYFGSNHYSRSPLC
ncbi:hypothetical protein HPB52_003103 [Rhipicephalus sanguineus]|uniref:Uncharacterized protein n=1 Tax=Rhipicephalus sanguineus TaxID=34632 RepID=A0A9D4T5C4_RHISA|nr:hypothetical protein HPB52_003103 [Rhipicephalus sanguineus]